MTATPDTKRTRTTPGRAIAIGAVVLIVAGVAFALAGGSDEESQLFTIGEDGRTTSAVDPEPVADSQSTVERGDGTARATIRSQVEPGHAYTLWWVIFNQPEACDGPCGDDDVFVDPADHFPDPEDPLAGFRLDQITAAEISAVWGGGAVADDEGRLEIDWTQREGEPPTQPGQVLLGTREAGAVVPISPVDGLTDAEAAQFLLILLDHGPAHEDADLREQQLARFIGACNPEPADPTVFPPDPGSCREVQFTVHR